MIEMEKVTKTYQMGKNEVTVLNQISLKIEEGEFVAIMGPSGSGKSTIMNMMGCLDRPTSGDYWLKGEHLSHYSEEQLAAVRNRSIGFVFQQFQLLPRMTAFKNVELPMIYAGLKKKEREQRTMEAIHRVGLADRSNHQPNELSGGQKQRIAIARALVNEPDVILADEPTGALDSQTSESVMNLFVQLNEEGTTIVMVTHEDEIADYARRRVMVRDGLIVHSDSPNSVQEEASVT